MRITLILPFNPSLLVDDKFEANPVMSSNEINVGYDGHSKHNLPKSSPEDLM